MDGKSSMLLPEEVQEYYTCHSCHKCCSVKPVKVHHNRKIKCGRCSHPNDGGILSSINYFMDHLQFYCINRFNGCQKLLQYTEVEEHEKTCKTTNIVCPACREIIPIFYIQKHFKIEHVGHSIDSPYIDVIFESRNNANYYLCKQGHRLLFILYYFDEKTRNLSLTALCIGNKFNNKHILQQVIICSEDNYVQCKSSIKRCPTYEYSTDHFQGFEMNINPYIPSYKIKFRIFWNEHESLIDSWDIQSKVTYDQIFHFDRSRMDQQNDPSGDISKTNSDSEISNTQSLTLLETSLESDISVTTPFETSPCGVFEVDHVFDTDWTNGPLSSQNNNHVCKICGMVCASGAGLASHMRAHERRNETIGQQKTKPGPQWTNAPLSSQTNNHVCKICGMVCASGAGLASHMRAHERRNETIGQQKTEPGPQWINSPLPSQTNNHICKICGMVCASGAGLASHMRAHERRNETIVQQRTQPGPQWTKAPLPSQMFLPKTTSYTCSQCGMACASGAGLASHMRAHERQNSNFSVERLFPISVSTGRQSNISGGSNFSMSSSSSSSSAGYTCSACGRVCQSGAGLASHMRAHARK